MPHSSVFSLPSVRTWIHLEKILETNLQPGSLPSLHALRNVSSRYVVRTQSVRYLLPSTQTQTSFPKDGKLLMTPVGALSPAPSPEPAAQARLPQPGSGQRDSVVRPLRTVILVGNFLTPRTLRCALHTYLSSFLRGAWAQREAFLSGKGKGDQLLKIFSSFIYSQWKPTPSSSKNIHII